MVDNEPLNVHKLRRALFHLLNGRTPTSTPVLIAVPVGFPIVEANYAIHERIPQALGLIRRYVLEGVCRFGPCTSAALDDLLRLGADIIEDTLVELSDNVPGIHKEGGRFTAGRDASPVLANREFAKVVTQQRRFVVNGLSDDLLPIDFWRQHDEWRIYPNPERPGHAFRDSVGQPTDIAVKIRDCMGYGREDLQRRIDSSDSGDREVVGIPKGGFGAVSEPESVEVGWVASFLLMECDGTLSIQTPHRQPLSLLRPRYASREYLLKVCEGLKPRELDRNSLDTSCDALAREFGGCARIRRGETPGQVLVGELAGQKDVASGALSKSGAQHVSRLIAAMVRGRYWDHHTRLVLHMLPADAETADRVALQRALRDLRIEIRSRRDDDGDGNTFDLTRWLDGWQDCFSRRLPHGIATRRITLDALLLAADDLQDTEFSDRLEALMRNHA